MPRLTAVCTCSRPISSRTATRVTRATSAIDVSASAIAGSVRCSDPVDERPRPSPSAGNQPRLTANTSSSTIAATNAGSAAEMVVADDHARVDRRRGRSAARRGRGRSPNSEDQQRRVEDQLERHRRPARVMSVGHAPGGAGSRRPRSPCSAACQPVPVAHQERARRGGSGARSDRRSPPAAACARR